jgi:ABC-type oligopeptide transport system ATPase subunit
MNQIFKSFGISAKDNNSDNSVQLQLLEKIREYGQKNNYKVITISHYCYFYQQCASWGGHAIVVFEPIEQITQNNSTNQTEDLLKFDVDFNQ